MNSLKSRVDRLEAAHLAPADNQMLLSPGRWDELCAVGEKARAEWEARTTPAYRDEHARWYAIKKEVAAENPPPDEPVTKMDAGFYARLREHLGRVEALAAERFTTEFRHAPHFPFG